MNGCKNAKVIGRTKAASGYTDSTDNCSRTSSSNNTSGCDDDGGENYYRIYLSAGDVIKVSLTTSWTCDFSTSGWTAALEIYSNSGCGDTTCAMSAVCKDDNYDQSDTFTAPQDGWFIIIVDSYDVDVDEGEYDLSVKLTCKTAGCGCLAHSHGSNGAPSVGTRGMPLSRLCR
jgi:hypothetical protein